MHASDWLSFAFSFGIVLALLGALLYALKRMQNGNLLGMGQRRIRVIDSMSLAPRQKIVLVRVKDQDILLGITVQQINTLASFYLSAEELAADAEAQTNSAENSAPLAQRFAELLKSAQNKNKG
ncbi:FliO Flagellar biogenesis protein [Oxalobacteraceae bacterium]